MTKKLLLIFVFAAVLGLSPSHAQVSYSAYNDPSVTASLLRDEGGNPISAGAVATSGNGQGAVVQLGYFSGSLLADEENVNFSTVFDGNFVSLLSFNSSDSSTGVAPRVDGQFDFSFTLSSTQGVKFPGGGAQQVNVPFSPSLVAGRYLVVRWYNNAGTFYNTAAAPNWVSVVSTTAAPPGDIDFIAPFEDPDNFDLVLQSGDDPSTGLRTLIPVPEPGVGSLAFASVAFITVMIRRRDQRKRNN